MDDKTYRRLTKLCAYGCGQSIKLCEEFCPTHLELTKQENRINQRIRDKRKRNDDKRTERHSLYKTKDWKLLRELKLSRNPLCEQCAKLKLSIPAKVADHIIPHLGDTSRFYAYTNLQSLCIQCHNEKSAREKSEHYSNNLNGRMGEKY